MTAIVFPPLPDGARPEWTGGGWRVGDLRLAFLPYTRRLDGWDDDLTRLHEEAGGAAHSIDVASRQRAIAALRKSAQAARAILEIGSSSGYLLSEMKAELPNAVVVGSDVISAGLEALHQKLPTVPLLQIDITDCPLASEQFDAVVALNVFEHIEDDGKALYEIARLLKPNGVLIAEVPAGEQLYDGYDSYLHHFRRYSKARLRQPVEAAGLQIVELGALGFVVYPAFWAAKKLSRLRHGTEADETRISRQISGTRESRMMKAAFALERQIALRMSLPVGIRWTLVARKPARGEHGGAVDEAGNRPPRRG